MTKQIKTSIHIQAKPEAVWNVLSNFKNYPNWNPFIKSLSGEVKVGNQIQIKLPGMSFKPTVLVFETNKELKWLGHLWVKGLFDGEHKFHLTENLDGSTTFEQSEIFTGILVKLFSKSLDKDTKSGFEEMNMNLKELAETKS